MNRMVQVSEEFCLDAGTVVEDGDMLEVHPPQSSLFDQLCCWLNQQPSPTIGFHHWVLGIGTAALRMRWGTYLAVLLDNEKPVDVRAMDGAVSMISDSEMKRINIEATSNLAHIFELMHKDEWAAYNLMQRAYEALPMPQKRVKRDWEAYVMIYGAMQAARSRDLTEYAESAQVMQSNPYRTLANFTINMAYRYGPIEDVHAGRDAAYPLDRRRFTLKQEREVIRGTAQKMSGIMGAYPFWQESLPDVGPWPERVNGLPIAMFYPRDWSYTESSSLIQLKREWTE